MPKILAIKARQILDSRGNPTVECDLKTSEGIYRASVPSGASTGAHEAIELRDGGEAFLGQGVQRAVKNINLILAKKLKGRAINQEDIDEYMIKLDGTSNKSKLGANAILAVSMAAARATGKPLYQHIGELYETKKFVLPVPAFNIINGGKHAGNKLDIQEYMIMPVGAKNFSEALQIGSEIYHTLKKDLENHFGKTAINIGDEGGFAPPFTCIEEPFDYITDAIIKLGYWKKVKLAIDCAATTFWRDGVYYLEGQEFKPAELADKYQELVNSYPIVSIEDPFYEEDFDNFAKLTKKLENTQIVGDDLLVTNPNRVQKAIVHESCNCLLLKINQIGTITEALRAAQMAMNQDWNVMVSHRSGETEDSFIADLSVGIASGQIKSGAPCRGERLAKYNQLLRIEEELGKKAVYAGKTLHFG
ncbi:MAG: phosphopyruvate hydratase [Candidatus Woesearchaeota archaeon]|nr:phosphopyruvate hydratase [Candidatus Woesearchaeota archaeon]